MMAEAETEEKPKKKSKALLFGLILAVLLGAGGFFAAQKGLIPGLGASHAPEADTHAESEEPVPGGDVEFVAVEPLTVTLTSSDRYKYLRFSSQIEVPMGEVEAVTKLMPRIVDAMNSYLRAVNPDEFERDGALLKLRSQLLRRVQLVVGETHATNLLVMEFVLN
ncbi:MAG: flagellar basal body-associated FliL family protein [Deltaproteobacteria bacterium]